MNALGMLETRHIPNGIKAEDEQIISALGLSLV